MSQKTSIAVSIIVPCRNEEAYIEACVRSIVAQKTPAEQFEVIVADGRSDDGTREILDRLAKEDPRLRVIDNPGRIVSTGLNAGIRAALGRIIIRMDVHTEYAPDYILQCLAVLDETRADNVGGPWVAKGDGLVGRAIAAAFQSQFSVGGPSGHDPGYEGALDTVYLGCWPRQVFERIGLFDEGVARNQDDEFNLRLTRAGGKVWQSPRIRSWYRPRESLGALFSQYSQYGYWKVRVAQKHRAPASGRHLVPGGFVFLLAVLPLLSLFWVPVGWAWLVLVSIYSACNVVASFVTAARHEWKLLPLLPVVFASYHIGYGWGFLRGIWDFVILRRGPARTYTTLTRRPADNASHNKTRTISESM
jgi:glycosyltransferase involved in cell wall biosynthesis